MPSQSGEPVDCSTGWIWSNPGESRSAPMMASAAASTTSWMPSLAALWNVDCATWVSTVMDAHHVLGV